MTEITASVEKDDALNMVSISDFVKAPRRVAVNATDYRGFDVRLVLSARRGGFDCASAEVTQREGGPAVTGEALRTLALGDLTSAAHRTLMAVINEPGDPEPSGGISSRLGEQLPVEIRDCRTATESHNRDVALRWAAARYVLADAVGLPPTREVQTAFAVSRATASRMIREARDRGLLAAPAGETEGKK